MTPDPHDKLRDALRAYLAIEGHTIVDLAARAKYDRKGIERFLDGDKPRSMNLASVIRLAEAMGFTLGQIFQDDQPLELRLLPPLAAAYFRALGLSASAAEALAQDLPRQLEALQRRGIGPDDLAVFEAIASVRA